MPDPAAEVVAIRVAAFVLMELDGVPMLPVPELILSVRLVPVMLAELPAVSVIEPLPLALNVMLDAAPVPTNPPDVGELMLMPALLAVP